MLLLRTFFHLSAFLIWMAFLALGFRSLPALGPLLSASRDGVFRHHVFQLHSQKLKGLKSPVTVAVDASGVPHFFAENLEDLVRAQGFVMASQRLFQMDLSTRMTAGRLSEWFGERTRKVDEFFVRFGLREAAEKTWTRFSQDADTRKMFLAFIEGVNEFIRENRDLSPEYRILGVRPELWDPLRIVHMDKQLTYSLAGRSSAIELTHIRQEAGLETVLDLFPDHSLFDDIVYPNSPAGTRARSVPKDFSFETHLKNIPPFRMPVAGNGSNNWAVSSRKSTTGFSIMANDTHLGHSLPNVWYEAQLASPDFNIYGVGLVGIPGLINGFNKNVSWGPTNGTTNVLDFLEIEFSNETSWDYRFGNQFVPAQLASEPLVVRGRPPEFTQVVQTAYGPMIYREGKWGLVARWTGHETDNELLALRRVYSSQNLDECLKSFSVWAAPIQNFVCVDKKDVSIEHVGRIPRRLPGEGRFVMPAKNPNPQFLTVNERPRLVRPASGFVLSANQRVVDENFPYDLGWDYEEPFRGRRIREILTALDKVSPTDMMTMQNDILDDQARLALPTMIAALIKVQMSADLREALRGMAYWNFKVHAGDWQPTLFKEWFYQFKVSLYSDEYHNPGREYWPKDTRTIEILKHVFADPNHPDARYVDDKTTERKETLSEVLFKSLLAAHQKLSKQLGDSFATWSFARWNRVQFPHVARFPGFGEDGLIMDGSGESIRGQKGNHGAVYKIVVAHGDWPKAFIQVPGGNEGDPFSPDYGRFLGDWASGSMRQVEYYHDVKEAKERALKVVELRPIGEAP